MRHRVRRLHLARALHRPDDALRFRGRAAAIATRSYFADPGAWCNCFKVSADGPPGLWRTVFPTEPDADRRGRLTQRRWRAGAAAEILPVAEALRGRPPQSLCHAPARRCDLPQGPRAARRRCRARQQPDRRHGPQWRHPGRRQSRRQARAHHARWRARNAARSLRPAAAHRRGRVRAGAVDREQEAARSARSRRCASAISTNCARSPPIRRARVSSCSAPR